uniref:Uncharacterized protein n=1 Tax=Plectus sambesii TaxID=2011161 RepID=A0A914VMZ1_9BILA
GNLIKAQQAAAETEKTAGASNTDEYWAEQEEDEEREAQIAGRDRTVEITEEDVDFALMKDTNRREEH